MKSLQEGMGAKGLIVMALVTNICEGALLGKSSAYGFLQKVRERRGLECFPEGCSTEINEAEELIDVNVGYKESDSILYNGAVASKEINHKPEKPTTETVSDEGSAM
ncbi:hypothetical protein ILYODFUR_020924 [Ilyodon furcidens]|uniref:Uncharacterized protein n=1 Tax=Ilyodon furcidens TaxID=33524 RepID=A0ABV0VH83_9TELE